MAVALLVVISGCGPNAKSPNPETDFFNLPSIRNFSLDSGDVLELSKDVTIFTWDKDLDPKTVKTVLGVADQIDLANANVYEISKKITSLDQIISDRTSSIDKQIDDKKTLYKKRKSDEKSLKSEIKNLERKLSTLHSDLEKEKAKDEASRDYKRIKLLEAEISETESEITNDNNLLAEISAELAQLQTDMKRLKLDRDEAISELTPIRERLTDEKNSYSEAARLALIDLKKSVLLYSPDIKLYVEKTNTSDIEITLYGWKLEGEIGDGANFSTRDGTIKNVKYETFGGVLSFDVVDVRQDGGNSILQVELRRSGYGFPDQDNSRIFFRGDIKLIAEDGIEILGKAKFTGN